MSEATYLCPIAQKLSDALYIHDYRRSYCVQMNCLVITGKDRLCILFFLTIHTTIAYKMISITVALLYNSDYFLKYFKWYLLKNFLFAGNNKGLQRG